MNKIFRLIKENKKVRWALIIIILIIIGFGFWFFQQRDNKLIITTTNTTENSNQPVRRLIDGVKVPINEANLLPLGLIIENQVSARPPSGLERASVIYEVLTEGGITRFLAIFATGEKIPEIGPIRSLRPYFLDWFSEYQGLLVHCGGSSQALDLLIQYHLLNLNQLSGDHPYFWRQTDRPAPHNLYTNSDFLTYALRDKKIENRGSFDPWYFKDDSPLKETEVIKKITIDFSTYNYQVDYQYDQINNRYLRSIAEQPSVVKSGEQLWAKNLIIQFSKTHLIDEQHLAIETLGQGEALVFIDGQVIKASWKKKELEKRTRYYNQNSEEIKFNAGPTWIEILPTDRQVSYE